MYERLIFWLIYDKMEMNFERGCGTVRIKRSRLLLLILAVVLSVSAIVYQRRVGFPLQKLPALQEGTVEIHIVDVGQADCTLIRTEAGHILIDAGEAETGVEVARYLRRAGVEVLAYAVFTHPDSDHIGGAPDVFAAVKVERVMIPHIHESDIPDTDVYGAFCHALAKEQGVKVIEAISGTEFVLGELTFRLLAPNSTEYRNINDYSIALRLDFAETSFLFTGDAEKVAENEMLARYPREVLDCTFFQAGHHGANTSNTDAFIEAVSPEIVAISCGKNSFGHPSGEALVVFARVGAQVYRTDEEGTMIFVSDGKQIIKK